MQTLSKRTRTLSIMLTSESMGKCTKCSLLPLSNRLVSCHLDALSTNVTLRRGMMARTSITTILLRGHLMKLLFMIVELTGWSLSCLQDLMVVIKWKSNSVSTIEPWNLVKTFSKLMIWLIQWLSIHKSNLNTVDILVFSHGLEMNQIKNRISCTNSNKVASLIAWQLHSLCPFPIQMN